MRRKLYFHRNWGAEVSEFRRSSTQKKNHRRKRKAK